MTFSGGVIKRECAGKEKALGQCVMWSTVSTGKIPKKKKEKIEQGPKTRSYAKWKAREDMVTITIDCRSP